MSTRKNVLLTTSREPTDRMRTFCNDIAQSMPNVIRVNRGKLSLDGIAEKAVEIHADRIVIVDRWKDGFVNLRFFETGISGLSPFPLLINVASVRLRREFEVKAKRIKSLVIIMPSENSSAAKKLSFSIGNFFDVPIIMNQGTVSSFSAVMRISSGALDNLQITFVLMPTLIEVGPRVNVSKVVWNE